MTLLKDYLESERKRILEKRKQLNQRGMSLRVLEQSLDPEVKLQVFSNGGIIILCEDYHLATGFTLEKFSESCGGNSYPDGGWSRNKYWIYPAFYFSPFKGKLRIPLLDLNFRRDLDKIALKCEVVARGWGDYSDKSRNEDHSIYFERVFEFLKEKKVPDFLLVKLAKKQREYSRFI
jgi:hypothetical protein